MALGSERGTGAVFFPFALASVSWEGLSLKTPVWNFSGFFPGVEQGARIWVLEIFNSPVYDDSHPNIEELSSLYKTVPLSTFSAIEVFFDVLDIFVIYGIIFF